MGGGSGSSGTSGATENKAVAGYMPLPPPFDIEDDWLIYDARLEQFF